MKQDFRPSSRFQIDELADFRRFILTGESGEAFTHARPAGCFGYRPACAGSFPQEKAVKPSPMFNLSGVSDIDGLRSRNS